MKWRHQAQSHHAVMMPADARAERLPPFNFNFDTVLDAELVQVDVAKSEPFQRDFDEKAVGRDVTAVVNLDSPADTKSLVRSNGQHCHFDMFPNPVRSEARLIQLNFRLSSIHGGGT